MKKTILFAAAAAVLSLTACSSNDNEPQGGEANGAARFSATIGAPQSRAFDQTWENGDKIGITGTTGGKSYSNVAYATTGDGNFSVVTPGSDIYYQDRENVTFTAYYPYAADASNIAADTWAQANQKQFDFLWAQAQGSKAAPNVAFSFAHKMAKIVIAIKKGADVSFDEVKKAGYALEGFKHAGTFNAVDGTATATGDLSTRWVFGDAGIEENNAPYTVDTDNETVSYTLIFFPQEFSAALPFTATITGMQSFGANLDFTAANSTAGDTDAKNAWVAGRQYNLSVTLNKTSLTVNGCTIQAWNETDGGEYEAE